MRRVDIEQSLRFSGLVKRYHVWPTHREQYTAEHTWHVMRIYIQLFGPVPPAEVMVFIQFHDSGELVGGDIPFGAKRRSPELKRISNENEESALDAMGIHLPRLSDVEFHKVKICDLMEMLEFGYEGLHMGNQYMWPVIVSVTKIIDKMLAAADCPLSQDEKIKVHLHMNKLERIPQRDNIDD